MDTISVVIQVILILAFLFAFYRFKIDDPDKSEEFAENHKILNILLNVFWIAGFIFTLSFMLSQ